MRGTELLLVFLLACGAAPMPGSIGIIAKRESATGRVIVVDVPAGSAGARAGFEKGDEIIRIDDQPVYRMSDDEFRSAARGPVGSKVMVEIVRDGLRQKLVVERVAIKELAAPK